MNVSFDIERRVDARARPDTEPASQASLLSRPVEGLDLNLSEFVTWRAEDEGVPVVRALIESAREVSPVRRVGRGPRSSRTPKHERRR